MSARWEAFLADPMLVWAIVAVVFAFVSWATFVGLPRYWAWSDRRRSVEFFENTDALPLEVYRPEDAVIGIDPSPVTGREMVVIGRRMSDGRIHIEMVHERTVDDE